VVYALSGSLTRSKAVDGVTVGCSKVEAEPPGDVKIAMIRRDGPPMIRFRRYLKSGKSVLKDSDFDLIHAHALPTPAKLGLELKKQKKVPLIITAHGEDIHRLSRKPIFRKWNQEALEGADWVTAVSKELADDVHAIHGVSCTFIPNGVDPDTFKPVFNSGAKDRPVQILFVGVLSKKKNVPLLISAISKLKRNGASPFRLTVIGDGPERPRIEKTVKNLGLEDEVVMKGRVPENVLVEAFGNADIFALPSDTEGLPMVIIQAMSCVLPVISTEVGGVAEAVEHGKTGLLVPRGDDDALAKALIALVADKKRREHMGRAGRGVVEKRFTWEIITRQYLDLYGRVLARY